MFWSSHSVPRLTIHGARQCLLFSYILYGASRELRHFVSIITRLQALQLRNRDSVPCKHKIILYFVFSKESRPALEPVRPPR